MASLGYRRPRPLLQIREGGYQRLLRVDSRHIHGDTRAQRQLFLMLRGAATHLGTQGVTLILKYRDCTVDFIQLSLNFIKISY